MKNTLTDLNNHLFEQIERLNDEDLSGDELKSEIQRAKVMSNVANSIIDNAALALDAQKFKSELRGTQVVHIPEMLEKKK